MSPRRVLPSLGLSCPGTLPAREAWGLLQCLPTRRLEGGILRVAPESRAVGPRRLAARVCETLWCARTALRALSFQEAPPEVAADSRGALRRGVCATVVLGLQVATLP